MKFCILFKGKFTRKQCGFSYARRRHTGSVSAHYALQLCCCRCCCLWRLAFDSPPVTPCVIDKILHPWLDDRLFRLACAFSKGRLTRLVTPAKHNSTGSLCNLLVAFQNVPCEAIFFPPVKIGSAWLMTILFQQFCSVVILPLWDQSGFLGLWSVLYRLVSEAVCLFSPLSDGVFSFMSAGRYDSRH